MKWGDSNFFISSDVTSLSNCCRLKSNIKDLGYFNSGSEASKKLEKFILDLYNKHNE